MSRGSSNVRSLLAWTVLALLAANAPAGDWPQFRGPHRDGVSRESGLLKTWPAEGPPELWRVPLGVGFSGAAVVGDRLYTMDSRDEKEHVVCFDTQDGREVWRTEVGPLFRESSGDGPRSTPTVADGLVWAVGSLGDVVALRAADGSRVWRLSIPERFGTPPQLFGFTMMPLVVGDLLILEVGAAEQDAIVALDKKTGGVVWRIAHAGVMANASPIHVKGPTEQLVFLNLPHLFSLSLDGELLWSVPFAPDIPQKIALPVFIEPDLVFASASYGAGGLTVRMRAGAEGERPVAVETAWQNLEMRNNINATVAHDGLLCGFDSATLKCLDASTGERLWAKRGGFGKGSLLWADGHLAVLTEHGRLLLVEAVREGYREKGTLQIINGRTWNPPSLADGRLYVRGPDELVALDVRGENATDTRLAAGGLPAGTYAKPASGSIAPAAIDVAAILARYEEARGGPALASVNTLRQAGRFTLEGKVHHFVLYHQRPNLYRYEVHRPDGLVSIEAYDGKVGWQDKIPIWRPGLTEIEISPLSEIPAARRAFLLENEADFEGPLIGAQGKGHDVRLLGSESLDDGTPVYHLKVTLVSGHVQHFYLDQRDFKVAMRKSSYPMGYQQDHQRVWYFTSHQQRAGVLMPISWELEDLPNVRFFEVDEIEVNAELSAELFAMPQIDASSP